MKRGAVRESLALLKKVFCWVGFTAGMIDQLIHPSQQEYLSLSLDFLRTGIYLVKAQTQKPVVVDIGLELRADVLGKLDGLPGDGRGAHGDIISVDVTIGAAPISISDAPTETVHNV